VGSSIISGFLHYTVGRWPHVSIILFIIMPAICWSILPGYNRNHWLMVFCTQYGWHLLPLWSMCPDINTQHKTDYFISSQWLGHDILRRRWHSTHSDLTLMWSRCDLHVSDLDLYITIEMSSQTNIEKNTAFMLWQITQNATVSFLYAGSERWELCFRFCPERYLTVQSM
jgi:hypothetical protein